MVEAHKIDIPSRYFKLCHKRRGRLHAYETIVPSQTALIVIDMQNAFVEPGLSVLEIPASRSITTNINLLASTMRKAGGHVVWTRHSFLDDWPSFYDHFTTPALKERMIEETQPGCSGHMISQRIGEGK